MSSWIDAPIVVFLDTNIFVHAFMASDERKRSRAVQLIEGALGTGTGRTSYQVVQEFANVARKKFAQRITTADCTAFIEAAMQPTNRVASSTELLLNAFELQDELRYSFYDSLVLATALQAGASKLYTEDLQHWQLVRGTLHIVNPFVDAVHESVAPLPPA